MEKHYTDYKGREFPGTFMESPYDEGHSHVVILAAENDYVHVKLPNGKTICIAGDGSIDIGGIPHIITPI